MQLVIHTSAYVRNILNIEYAKNQNQRRHNIYPPIIFW